ncbi:hypothetical protein RHGRI_021630 [Rhododendron griersonianum]|uniref:Uncharacterized protein n=1 Tax=Rhododendron griersonianum TaxID=479676 RepID=A0AAV6JPX6_9ERIC|nr:hypothetical protein RHGRI_021630 [Rhododendron griersonianum]
MKAILCSLSRGLGNIYWDVDLGFLYFMCRKVWAVDGNWTCFGILMPIASFRVDGTIIYITLMEEGKNVTTAEKESLVDEKTIQGSGIAPRNEAHANMH